MAIVYSGDTGFLQNSLYVIGVNGNFITRFAKPRIN